MAHFDNISRMVAPVIFPKAYSTGNVGRQSFVESFLTTLLQKQ
jgi:hypothetical protein